MLRLAACLGQIGCVPPNRYWPAVQPALSSDRDNLPVDRVRAAAEWERLVQDRFGWLVDRGFRFDGVDSTSNWVTSVRYLSSRHCISIDQNLEFLRAEVVLIRLEDGHMPLPARRYRASVLLDNVVEARAPERLAEVRGTGGLSDDAVTAALDHWADILKQVVRDLLDGGDQAFGDADEVVRERVRRAQRPPDT